MKLKINQENLNRALSIVSFAINPNNTLPILNNILLEAKNQELNFSATNLEIAITLSIKANVTEEGSITIPAKLITTHAGLLPKEEIELTSTEDFSLKIKTKKSDTKITGLKAEDFPTLPKLQNEVEPIEIKAHELKFAIDRVAFAASLNTSRPTLSGVYMKANDLTLTLAATDSYRLAENKLKLSKKVTNPLQCIIPARTMQELSKILSNFSNEMVQIVIDKNQTLFVIENVKVISRLIEGNFPDYEKIIPPESKTKIKINGEDLGQALKRVNLFAREINNAIHFGADKETKKLTVMTDETRIGEDKTEIDVEILGESNNISLNSEYLLDVLSLGEREKLLIEMNGKLSPIKVKFEKNEDYIYIIMPLKI